MADEAEIKLTVHSKPKLSIEKVRDPRPSVWLSVFKWVFAILLSVLVLACVVASKISLISIGIFYNNTSSDCPGTPAVEHSKETTFIMMVLVLMIPQFMSLLRACWSSLFCSSHPWPTTSAIFWGLLAALLEVVGFCYFIIVIILKTRITAAHCVVIMNSVFLVPILGQIIKLRKKISLHCLTFVLLLVAFCFELLGIIILTYHVMDEEKIPEFIGIPISLLLVSFAWSNKIQKLQIERRYDDNGSTFRNSFTGSMPSIAGSHDTSLNDDDGDREEDTRKETARGKSSIISGTVKLVITPFVAALFCYAFKVADLGNLHGGFEKMTVRHPAFPAFMAQIFGSFVGNILGWLACAMCMQRLAFCIPLFLATPVSMFLLYIPKICCSAAIPFKCGDFDDKFLIPLSVCLWLAQVLSTGVYLWKEQSFIMAKESKLFWLPVYNGAFLEQNLLLNRKNKITDENQVNQRELAKKTCVYICTTMYHETENEMEQLLHSLHDIDIARQGSKRQFESHIFFDGAVKGDVLNDYVLQLISLVPKTLKVKIENCMKLKTPYGMQLRWRLPGGMPFHIHLKDNLKVKNKKRWSQAMYMSYVLDYKEATMETNDDNTYILATDADVRFSHESVQALLDFMMRDEQVGAVCGRTHPLGSGPVVWYQVFDYAIGHWFQKVANHVLGSVLCSPGCFSVYRARAIRDVLPLYASRVNTSLDFLTKDMGEDRWLCTLMVQSGWRLEYCAAAEDSTFCPDTFDEFFQQRRRWIPSTLVNLIQLISQWKVTLENNDKISILFIFYQAVLVVSTLISPATVILVITGALKYSKLPGSDNDMLILVFLCIITFGFAFICLYTKQSFQLKVAKILTVIFSLLMAIVVVGMAAQIAIDLNKRADCADRKTSVTPSGNHSIVTTLTPTTLPIECTDHLPADVSSLYLAGLVGIFMVSALMHPTEAYCLVHGIWYLCCLPSGYLLLIIYSLANITDRSWGTREAKDKKVGEDVPWYQAALEKLRYICMCCRPEEKPVPSEPVQKTTNDRPGEEGSSDSVFSDDEPSSEDSRSSPPIEATSEDKDPQPTHSLPVVPLPDPPKSALKSNLRRAQSTEEHLSEEKPKWRFPGEKKTVRFDTKMPKLYSELPVEDWLPSDLRHLYAKYFIDNGYDNVSFIVGMTDKDLRSIGISKRGHRMQLKHLIERIPHIPLNTDIPENVEEWLHELGLENYWICFKSSGYTEPRTLEDLKAMDNETLHKTLKEELNINKVAHVKKMIRAVHNLQYPTPAQREIRHARDLVNKVHVSDIAAVNQDDGKEYKFWKSLRAACLLPESAIFGAVTELKEKLEDLRDSFLTVFAIANVMWIIILVTLDKQSELKVIGTNAIGFAFLAIYGLIIVVQFLTLIWHRISTWCHLLARAPWKRGPYQLSWAFNDENLPPEPTSEELEQIRRRKNTPRRRKTGRRRISSGGSVYQHLISEDGPSDYSSTAIPPPQIV